MKNNQQTLDKKPPIASQVLVFKAIDPDNLIVVGTPRWSQGVDQAAANPVPGQNIAYALHFYAATHKQWLRDRTAAAIASGIAIFVTEWGVCEASGGGYLDHKETEAWLSFMATHKLSWANWSISNKLDQTCALVQPHADPTGGWPASSLTTAGILMR
ncbi:MAG: cellulase family glycosylhydrolase, partial [Deltaproteobacteria bacterium]|nr:cellulase family glycosylhydrolase [Deltaproteobacteria bacterium]